MNICDRTIYKTGYKNIPIPYLLPEHSEVQIGEFMHKKYLFVWGDHEGYAYNESLLYYFFCFI